MARSAPSFAHAAHFSALPAVVNTLWPRAAASGSRPCRCRWSRHGSARSRRASAARVSIRLVQTVKCTSGRPRLRPATRLRAPAARTAPRRRHIRHSRRPAIRAQTLSPTFAIAHAVAQRLDGAGHFHAQDRRSAGRRRIFASRLQQSAWLRPAAATLISTSPGRERACRCPRARAGRPARDFRLNGFHDRLAFLAFLDRRCAEGENNPVETGAQHADGSRRSAAQEEAAEIVLGEDISALSAH